MSQLNLSSHKLPSISEVTLPNYNLPFQLQDDNYVLWKTNMLPAVIGSNLEGFVTGAIQEPPMELPSKEEGSNCSTAAAQISPDYMLWRSLDSALLGWMSSSISNEVYIQIPRPQTTLQLWNSLEKLFRSRSREKLMQLKLQLQSRKKGALTMNAYFSKMKEISDNLALAGYAVSNNDFVVYLLGGLPSEYDAVIANINSNREPIEIEEVLAMLVSQEIRIQQNTIDRGGLGGRGRGHIGGSCVVCQLCGLRGHVAAKCWYRFDRDFQPNNNNNNNYACYSSPDILANPDVRLWRIRKACSW